MQNAETIYQQIVSKLQDSEKLRLATIILENLSSSEAKSQSAFDLLQTIQGKRVFSSSRNVDEHLKMERESWDN